MDRPDLGPRIRCGGGGVERRVLDVMTHADDEGLAHRLDIGEGAAVVEPELAVVAGFESEVPGPGGQQPDDIFPLWVTGHGFNSRVC